MSIESQLTEALRGPATVFLRLALGVAFLSAVADRFGLWGPAGAKNVAWGDFAHFTQYSGQLNPWAPAALITARVGSVLPLDQARRAHEMLAGAPHDPGKIMLEVR